MTLIDCVILFEGEFPFGYQTIEGHSKKDFYNLVEELSENKY